MRRHREIDQTVSAAQQQKHADQQLRALALRPRIEQAIATGRDRLHQALLQASHLYQSRGAGALPRILTSTGCQIVMVSGTCAGRPRPGAPAWKAVSRNVGCRAQAQPSRSERREMKIRIDWCKP